MYNSLRKLRALMILLLFLLNTSLADQPGQGQRRLIETFSIITRDRYGDTWNGGVLSVTDVDTGEVVETFTGPENSCKYNPPEFTCERIETISLYCGSYSASTSGGSWPEERTWSIKNAAGSTVAEGAGTSIAHFSTVACMSCGFGRGSLSGTECKDCPEGKYSDVDGPGYCKVCPGGTYSDSTLASSIDTCLACDAGKASATTGATSESACVPCGANTYSGTASSELCSPCPEGKFSAAQATECVLPISCPAGKEPSSLTECSNCPGNTFSNLDSIDPCSTCPPGKYSERGAVECTLDVPPPIIISGMCSEAVRLNGIYRPVQKIKSGRFYFANENWMYLFWDSDCSGKGNPAYTNWWWLSYSVPSSTLENDLDEDGTCSGSGYIPSTSMAPPLGTNEWTILCGTGFISIPITVEFLATCPAGKEPISSTECEPCQANYFSSTSSTLPCDPCQEGTFSLGGSATCSAATCPAGQEPTSTTDCAPCQMNTYSSTSSTDLCAPCPKGTFSIGGPANTFSNVLSTELCSPCESGKYSDYGATQCTLDTPPAVLVSGVCLTSGYYNGFYKPIHKTKTGRWAFKNDNGRFLYWGSSCTGADYKYDESMWIFDGSLPSLSTDGVDTNGDCRYGGYTNSESLAPPIGNNIWMIKCNFQMTPNELSIEAIVSADHSVSTQLELVMAIDTRGADKMTPGDRLLVQSGTYTCNSAQECHNIKKMLVSGGNFGSIICTERSLGCVLDGEGKRDILWVDGTGKDKLAIKGIKFYRGNSTLHDPFSYGGGLGITNQAIVKLEFCSFDSCYAHQGGAIFLNGGTTLTAYGTSFKNNSAEGTSDDIGNGGDLAIYDSCPDGWTGIPEKGSPIITAGAVAYGTTTSFSIGSCTVCPLGKAGPRGWYDPSYSSTCEICTLGKYRSREVATCTICAAGQYNSNDGTDASLHKKCDSCPAGKYLSDEDTPVVTSHDSADDCSMCKAGTYSNDAAPLCIECKKGKYLANDGTDITHHDDESDCLECDAGKYNDHVGGISCASCGKGKYLTTKGATSETTCTLCEKGKYNDDVAQLQCKTCPPGKIAPSDGYEKCADCITGTYASAGMNMTECKQCDFNHFSDRTGAATCSRCEEGRWADFLGAVECQHCPQHFTFNHSQHTCICQDSFILVQDQNGKKHCTCKAGETLVDDKCAPCEDGRFKGFYGTERCEECDVKAIEGALETVFGAEKTSADSCACGVGKFAEEPDEDNKGTLGLRGICKNCADIDLPEGGASQ
ncbi:hypothetical protein TrVE_jg4515 [Triparma verrucosa]|uniref:TNFR-Cys domain-containing protein n=1 Tax=Triparma verrucosa TaxID=1606542 RepID=A0A9W7KTX6_9STRA|nr:hypothetical protein TrVE_jg4515 [Triparma verrucosa]